VGGLETGAGAGVGLLLLVVEPVVDGGCDCSMPLFFAVDGVLVRVFESPPPQLLVPQ
jgi:hypothetical protein